MTDHEIILVSGTEIDNDEGFKLIIESVGKWDVVSEEELNILRCHRYRGAYHIIERNRPCFPYGKKEPLRTPQDYIAEYRAEEAKRVEREKQRRAVDEKTKLDRKRKQLERLKKQLGET